ncbi:MAG: transglycosylase SLT domain-containing protein [bacterium]
MTFLNIGEINKIDTEIADNAEYEFKILESGIYIIEVIASAKSWWQNLKGWRAFFNDDDLAIKIDGIEFPKLSGKRGLFDGEAAWNGNNLKGLKKIDVFVVELKSGERKIEFITEQYPHLESIKIIKADNESFIEYIPSDENKQAQDGNNRQWINLVFAGLPIKEISITAKAEKRAKDSDDIKLIIDGGIQENKNSKYFKNWHWAGSLDNGEKKIFQKELNLPNGLHYVELWADRMPSLENIKITLEDAGVEDEQDEKQQIMAKVVWEITKFRSEPKLDEQNILRELKYGDEAEIIEKTVAGERPINEKGEFLESDRWHKVKRNGKEGYIFSMALEIGGEAQEAIQNFIIQKSKELEEDECLMLAIAKRESKFFPYSVSQVADDYQKGRGVMQLTDQTRDEMRRNEYINYDLIDPFDFKKNIEGGIIYFKFIRTLYRKDSSDYLEKLLVAWNRGPYFIPKNERDKPLNYNSLPGETADFIEKVKSYYEEYKNNGREGFIKIFWMIIFCGISILFGSIISSCYMLKISKNNKKEKIISANIEMVRDEDKEKFYRLEDNLDGDGDKETVNFHFYYGEILERITEMEFQGQIFKMQGAPSGFSKDINGDGIKEVIVELAVGANGIWTEIYQLNNSGKLEIIPTVPEYGSPGFFNKNGIKFVDYDDDGDLEVRLNYNDMPDSCVGQADIYEYVKGIFIKSAELKVYEETCRESMKKVTG